MELNSMKRVLNHAEFKVGTEQNYPMVGRGDSGDDVVYLFLSVLASISAQMT